MKRIYFLLITVVLVGFSQQSIAQKCKTNAELDTMAGKYLTATQYPWPAVRAGYFNNLKTAADKATAKVVLGQLEKAEQKTRESFKLTGGNWESIYTSKGYDYLGMVKLGQYNLESSLHEFFCLNGQPKRNDEAGTILRIYVNTLPLNTLDRFVDNPFGSSFGDYDFGLQYSDFKNHNPADVNARLITLFNYLSCNSNDLLQKINTGEGYFQSVPEKDTRPNTRDFVYRYWFVKKNDLPLLIPVSRKEYLQSLLEYYEREKLYFPKLIAELTAEHSKSVNQYTIWEADVADKIAVAKKELSNHDEKWLAAQAVINRIEDASQTYKAGLRESTNYNRFWKFYDGQNKSEPLYQYNQSYFTNNRQSVAKPQIISLVFRYNTIPASLRLVNNFTKNIDVDTMRKLLK